MKIVLVDTASTLEKGLREQGHDVFPFALGGGVFHLPGLLAHKGVIPDLVLQQERLGPRSFCTGLEDMPCPTVFWAIDSHLNLFWHRWYGLLFDAVLTPHVSLFDSLAPPLRPPHRIRFAWPGCVRAFRPHGERGRALSLCARIDANRPARAWMAKLLAPLGLHLASDLSWSEMMALYDDTRIVPNESIANEVNFRLMEAASSGCLSLTPDVGEDQNALLEPGTECLVYRDGQELLELTAWAAARTDRAERPGKAAMRRIQAEHLPVHRAATLAGLGSGLPAGRLTGDKARAALWLTFALQARNDVTAFDATTHAAKGRTLAAPLLASEEPLARALGLHVVSQTVLLLAEGPDGGRDPAGARTLCEALIKEGERDRSRSPFACLELASACSAAALGQNNFALAGACRLAWSRTQPSAAEGISRSPAALCVAWASSFARRDILHWAGFRFIPECGKLPESALSWLLFARHIDPGDPSLPGRTAELLAHSPALAPIRLGFLAEQSLAAPDDWRVQQDYGLANIRTFRVEEGFAELEYALAGARAAGQQRAFLARLKAKSPVMRPWRERLP